MIPAAEFRAAIYDQALSTAELAAFPKVASASAIELAQTAVDGLKAGRVIITFTALRGLIERVAHSVAVADKVKSIKAADLDGPLAQSPVIDLCDVISKSLYATQRDWSQLAKVDFRKVSPKDVVYLQKEGTADMHADRIMTAIKALDKQVPGARLAYEVLCEFAHPNVGDLFGTTIECELAVDKYGTRHAVRILGLGPKSWKGMPELLIIRSHLLDVCGDVISQMLSALDEIYSAAQVAAVLTRRRVHKMVKRNRSCFSKRDLCPCLSGLTIEACRSKTAKVPPLCPGSFFTGVS